MISSEEGRIRTMVGRIDRLGKRRCDCGQFFDMSFLFQKCYFWLEAKSEAREFSKRGVALDCRKRLNFCQVEDIYNWKHLSIHVSREDDKRKPTQEELNAKKREQVLAGMGDEFVQWFALNNKRVLDALKPAQAAGDDGIMTGVKIV